MHTFQCHIDIGSSLACSAHFIPSHPHALMMWLFCLSAILPSTSCCQPSLLSSWSSLSSSMMWETSTLRTLANEDLGTLAEYDTLTSYEPNDLHISETTELYIQESSGENGSLNLYDLEYDDYTIGIALSSPLFTQEREDAASRRRACHSPDEGVSSSQSSSVGHRTGRLVVEQFDSLISNVREIRATAQKMRKSGYFWNDKESRFSLTVKQRFKKHEFQADHDRRSIQKLNEVTESQRGEIYRAHQGDEQFRRDQQLLHEQSLEQNRDLREAHEKGLSEMEELKRLQGPNEKIGRRSRHYP